MNMIKRNIAKKKSNVDIETTLSNLEQKENKAEAEGEAKQEVAIKWRQVRAAW